jgi:16S rRNA (cytosine1402-N4)-methyltransferase
MHDTTSSGTKHHESVLLHEAVAGLLMKEDDVVVDATLGGAGHFSALLGKLGDKGVMIGIDADKEAVERAKVAGEGAKARVLLASDNFRNLNAILDGFHIEKIDKSLFDLGWSGYQLSRGRGFSFKTDEPLLMTYGEPEEGKTAADAVNTLSEEALANVIYEFGEERFSRAIAKGIVRARSKKPIVSTAGLSAIILDSTPRSYHHGRIHPATRTFQALRIYVNDEYGAFTDGITSAIARTNPGGRIAVLTFHSAEDRIVKNLFKDAAAKGQGTIITKKPIAPSYEEVRANPRARSAKLRIFECARDTLAYV